jgi:hypothetical protein
VLAGIGTAVLSPFTIGGELLLVLIIPISILGTYWHSAEDGFIISLTGTLIATVLLPNMGWQTAVVYLLATGIAVWLADSYMSKEYEWAFLILWITVGTLLLELFLDLFQGVSVPLHSDYFLGSSADSGIRVAANAIIGFLLYTIWPDRIKTKKKK